MTLKPITLRSDACLGNVDMSLQDCIPSGKKKELEQFQMEVQREKERKHGEWAELVLAGKTNLSLCDWMSKKNSER